MDAIPIGEAEWAESHSSVPQHGMSLATQHSQKSGRLTPSPLSNSTVSCGWMSAVASATTRGGLGTPVVLSLLVAEG